MNKLIQTLLVLVVALCVLSYVGFRHIESLNQDKKSLEQTNATLTADNQAKQQTITEMAALQKEEAAIDAKHMQDMNRAKSDLETLQHGIANGTIGLHVNAKCPAVPSQATTSSMGDGASPGLADAAQRDYYTLRDRINTATSQINYLQDYIKNVCFAASP